MAHLTSDTTHRTPQTPGTDAPRRDGLGIGVGLWVAVSVAYVLLLLAFPIPMIAIGMTVCAALMTVSLYVLAKQAHFVAAERQTVLDQRIPRVLLAVVVIGSVAAFVWPSPTAVAAFTASVFTCVAWITMERTLRKRLPH
jgi:hypothetical protein